MAKRRTVLIVILSLFLAALVAAAAVLGCALSRSAFSDASEAYASEARWKISETTGRTVSENGFVLTESFMPRYGRYDGSGAARQNEFFGVAAVLQNDGDVDASVSVTLEDGYNDGGYEIVLDGCERYDHNFYDEEDVNEHVVFRDLYCSMRGDLTLDDIGSDDLKKVLDGQPLTAGSGECIYFYAHIIWVTDLDRDVYITEKDGYVLDENGKRVYGYTVSDGTITADGVTKSYSVGSDGYIYDGENRVPNPDYDGTEGDEFDNWAGLHFDGVAFKVDITCAQAK